MCNLYSRNLSVIICAVALLAPVTNAFAGVIGTFENRAGQYSGGSAFNLFSGSLMDSASSSLIGNGHSLINMDAGISASSLANVDIFYASLATDDIVTSAIEDTVLYDYVLDGGNLAIQADYAAYDNVLNLFGVTRNQFPGTPNTSTIVNAYTPLTNGLHGSVTSLQAATASTFNFDASPGGVLLDSSGIVGVLSGGMGLSLGAGTVVFLGDINLFDGPRNSNGFSKADNSTLWNNIFELTGPSASVPEPATLALIGLGLLLMRSSRYQCKQ